MGGVVNIITKRGRPDSPQTNVSAGYDGQKTKSVGLSTNGGNQDVSYQFNAKWADSNGYKPSPDPVPLTMRHSLQDEHGVTVRSAQDRLLAHRPERDRPHPQSSQFPQQHLRPAEHLDGRKEHRSTAWSPATG